MRTVVVGNGIAGVIFSKTLRDLNPQMEIDIYTEEKYHYYPRPNLIEFLALNLPYEKIFAFPEKWYKDRNLNVHLQESVRKIDVDSQKVEIKGGKKENFDVLFLANGARPFIPPFKGVDKKGVFTLRTVDDCMAILDYLKNHPKVTIIGGGLLGLEIARGMRARGAEVEVLEYFEHLLPRQLDVQGASLLKQQIEKMGIKVRLGSATEAVLGQKEVEGLRLKEGNELKTEMAIVAAGVRSDIDLAKHAGLEVDRGVVVNDYLRTTHSRVYAGGDNLQHRGKNYGIIPAAFSQAKVAAHNAAGEPQLYRGTVPSNTLKVMGIHLTSIGLIKPEKSSYRIWRREDREKGIYKKVVVHEGIPVGAVWLGTKKGINEINRVISQKVNIEKWEDSILQDDFDFSVL
ncbi:NAD(P)/FAD-dependent oxidoreductase [bacterium]|nr:NAD(P)/FAD-dependent oxidoreductase [bacterium]